MARIDVVDSLCDVASPAVARRYEVEIKRRIGNLRGLPSTGAPRQEFGPSVRLLIVRPYLIFYEDASDHSEVLILRILHGSRNIKRSMIRRGH